MAAAAVVAGYALAVLVSGLGQGVHLPNHPAPSYQHAPLEAPLLVPESAVRYLPGMPALRPGPEADRRREQGERSEPEGRRGRDALLAWLAGRESDRMSGPARGGDVSHGAQAHVASRTPGPAEPLPALVLRVGLDYHGAPDPPIVPSATAGASGEWGRWRGVPASTVRSVETPPPIARG